MSRLNTPVSDLSRLALGGGESSGGEMAPVTRSMASRRPTHHQRASQATTGSSRNTGRHSSLAAGPSQRTARANPPEDSDSSDDSDGEDEGNDEDDRQAQVVRAMRADGVLRIMSIFEPNQLTYPEMRDNVAGQTEISRLYRRFTETVTHLVRNNNDLNRLLNVVQTVPGPVWDRQTIQNMELRAQRIFERFNVWLRTSSAQDPGNVQDTVDEIFSLFRAVDGILGAFDTMPPRDQCDLVRVLIRTLHQVVLRNQDVRTQTTARGVVYAGGVGQYEHNLFLRFASSERIEANCWRILQTHIVRHADTFQQRPDLARFRDIGAQVNQDYAAANGNSRNVLQAFLGRLRIIMQNLGGV